MMDCDPTPEGSNAAIPDVVIEPEDDVTINNPLTVQIPV